MDRKNLLIVIGLTLFLILSIFLGGKIVREGTMLFGRATAPSPTPSPSPLLQPIYFPSPTPTPTPTPKTYNLQDFSRMIDALGTANLEFDFNKDGIVNQADINLFKQRYQ